MTSPAENKAKFAWSDDSEIDFIDLARRYGCYSKGVARQLRAAMKATHQGADVSDASMAAYLSRCRRVMRDFEKWNGRFEEWREHLERKSSQPPKYKSIGAVMTFQRCAELIAKLEPEQRGRVLNALGVLLLEEEPAPAPVETERTGAE